MADEEETVYMEDYSAKSFVVRGGTRPHKESLKALGGKWNASLTDKETSKKFGAWLFWSNHKTRVTKWMDEGMKTVMKGSVPIAQAKKMTLEDCEHDILKEVRSLRKEVADLKEILGQVLGGGEEFFEASQGASDPPHKRLLV